MNATELMIGDWVIVRRPSNLFEKLRVKSVIGNGTIEAKTRDGLVVFGELAVDPIPLTGEILEKNGFAKKLDTDGLHYRFTLIGGYTWFSVRYVRSVFQWLGPLDFKYVHELQHALRLSGIEKEIVL